MGILRLLTDSNCFSSSTGMLSSISMGLHTHTDSTAFKNFFLFGHRITCCKLIEKLQGKILWLKKKNRKTAGKHNYSNSFITDEKQWLGNESYNMQGTDC